MKRQDEARELEFVLDKYLKCSIGNELDISDEFGSYLKSKFELNMAIQEWAKKVAKANYRKFSYLKDPEKLDLLEKLLGRALTLCSRAYRGDCNRWAETITLGI